MRKERVLCFLVLIFSIATQIAFGQEENQGTTPPWPRKFVSGGTTISLYQPQLQKWQDNQLSAMAAMEVQTANSKTPSYGVVWFDARTEIDKVNREVTLLDFNFRKSNFPTAANNGQEYVDILKQQLPNNSTMSLDQLEADLNLTDAKIETQEVPLQNDPPQIFFSTSPAVLVLIDGEPNVRPVGKFKLQRVINTRTLILFDPSKKIYYLQLMDGWMESPSVTGGWLVSKKAPKDADKIQAELLKNKVITPLHVPDANGNSSLKNGVPVIYVSTTQAELLQSQGQPDLVPIPGTQLLYVKNSSDD